LIDDAAAHSRYAKVPSVMSLRLRAVLCVPMTLGGRVLGAFFLARNDVHASFSERYAEDLALLAGMSIPLLAHLRKTVVLLPGASDAIIGESQAMQNVRRLVQRVAPSDVSVLLGGETGTGKEVVARAIHAASPRASRPMVAITCSAVPESLLGAELFGSAKGAFTGAVAHRAGKVEDADGSTLFLDEVGDMPLPMQAALLRVLEEREVTRLGENVPRKVDFRLVAATHRDLDAEVRAGRFREDLLFRIREVFIDLPPLRARDGDVELLGQMFLNDAVKQFGLGTRRFAPDAITALHTYAWPGNVRELRGAMRRTALLSDGPAIHARDLKLGTSQSVGSDLGSLERTLDEARDAFTPRFVAAVLEQHGGNREKAAAALGISMRSMYRFL
jgi:DNA-binding NtrC family response regulator